jgi:hypothetical protein
VVLDELGNEEGREHIALLHPVADVHVPLLDVSVHLRKNRVTLEALGETRLPDNTGDLPDLRLDEPHRLRLCDARSVALGFMPAPGHCEGSDESEHEPERWQAALGVMIRQVGKDNSAHH